MERERHWGLEGLGIGIIVGILWHYSKVFRLIVCLIGLYLIGHSIYRNWIQESVLDDSVHAVDFQARVVEGPYNYMPGDGVNLTYKLNYQVTNVQSKVIDHLTIQQEIYDCPSQDSDLSDCTKVGSMGYMPDMYIAQGNTWNQNHMVSFTNLPDFKGVPKVSFYVHDVNVDEDSSFARDEAYERQQQADLAKWEAR